MKGKKIAVVFASPCAGTKYEIGEGVPNHYRYTVYERKLENAEPDWTGQPPKESAILLRYGPDVSIEEVLSKIKIEFGVRRGVKARTSAVVSEGDLLHLPVAARISGDDRIIVHPLGLFDAPLGEEDNTYECYLIYQQSDVEARNAVSYFSITRVPYYGRAKAAYQPHIARDFFTMTNITGIMHGHAETDGDRQNMVTLFDWIDERVAKIMEPMVALLPEVV